MVLCPLCKLWHEEGAAISLCLSTIYLTLIPWAGHIRQQSRHSDTVLRKKIKKCSAETSFWIRGSNIFRVLAFHIAPFSQMAGQCYKIDKFTEKTLKILLKSCKETTIRIIIKSKSKKHTGPFILWLVNFILWEMCAKCIIF